MRAYLPAYSMLTPTGLGEALTLLHKEPGRWKPFAGGTDLMVLLEAGALKHHEFINLWRLSELRGIQVTDKSVWIGALTTYTEIREHPLLRAEFPMLCEAARETGAIAIQS